MKLKMGDMHQIQSFYEADDFSFENYCSCGKGNPLSAIHCMRCGKQLNNTEQMYDNFNDAMKYLNDIMFALQHDWKSVRELIKYLENNGFHWTSKMWQSFNKVQRYFHELHLKEQSVIVESETSKCEDVK